MLKIDDADNFRRTVAGVCLILAPLVLALAQLVHPGQGADGIVQMMAEKPGGVETAGLMVILSSVLFVPVLVEAGQGIGQRIFVATVVSWLLVAAVRLRSISRDKTTGQTAPVK